MDFTSIIHQVSIKIPLENVLALPSVEAGPDTGSKGLFRGRKQTGPSHQDMHSPMISLEIQRINEHTKPSCSEPGQELLFDARQTKLAEACRPNSHKMVDLYLLSLSCGDRTVTEGAKALRPVQECQRKVESPPPTDRDPLKPPELEGDVVQQSQEASHRSPLTSCHQKNHLWLCLRPCAHLSHGSAQHPQTKLQFHVDRKSVV